MVLMFQIKGTLNTFAYIFFMVHNQMMLIFIHKQMMYCLIAKKISHENDAERDVTWESSEISEISFFLFINNFSFMPYKDVVRITAYSFNHFQKQEKINMKQTK